MEIQKVKEWLVARKHQFVLSVDSSENWPTAMRISDGKLFNKGDNVFGLNNKWAGKSFYIGAFLSDMIHVRVYDHLSIYIEEVLEINEIDKAERRPRRRVVAKKGS